MCTVGIFDLPTHSESIIMGWEDEKNRGEQTARADDVGVGPWGNDRSNTSTLAESDSSTLDGGSRWAPSINSGEWHSCTYVERAMQLF